MPSLSDIINAQQAQRRAQMTHEPYTPYAPAIEARNRLGAWASGVAERSTPTGLLNALASEAQRYQQMQPEELATSFGPSGGLAGMTRRAAKTEFELAHEVAQRNAALPVEQGGLGLPQNNTAMDRAKALGYPMDLYGKPHSNMGFSGRSSTNAPMKKAEVIKAELEQLGIPVRGEQAISGSTYLDFPGNPYQVDPMYGGGQSVPIEQIRFSTHSKRADGLPINEPDSGFLSDVFPKNGNTMDEARQSIKDMIARGGIRSRFAAFDPMQRNSANILAGGLGGAIGLNTLADLVNQQEYY